MKICFVSSMHPALDKRVFDKEAVYLSSNGFDVTHLAPGDEKSWIQNGVNIITYTARNGIVGRVLQLMKLFNLARSVDADVYHCNEVDSWVVGVALKIRYKKICVFDVHEHYPEDFAEMRFPIWFRPPVRLLIKFVMWVLSKFTDRIVLAKSSLMSDFQTYPKNKIVAAQNFTPLSALVNSNQCDQIEYSDDEFDSRPLKIIHLGLFNECRGLFQMLESIKDDKKNFELLFLGEYSDGTNLDLSKIINSYGLTDYVKYKSWVPFDEALEYVKNSDVGLIMFQPGYFNHVHALPHKLFDYMASGIPVIAPDFAIEVAEIVSDAECGLLVDSTDYLSLRNALESFIKNPSSINIMGENGKAAIKAKYNWDVEGDKLVNMYKELKNEY
jgi:glycosyltransferase involved in cell wall biosynthesis